MFKKRYHAVGGLMGRFIDKLFRVSQHIPRDRSELEIPGIPYRNPVEVFKFAPPLVVVSGWRYPSPN